MIAFPIPLAGKGSTDFIHAEKHKKALLHSFNGMFVSLFSKDKVSRINGTNQ